MAKKRNINYSALIAEYYQMRDRLEELEEIFQSDNGEWLWRGSGEPVAGKLKPTAIDRAIHAAVAAIYFNDNSDYRSALWEVVNELDPSMSKLLERKESDAFDLSAQRAK